MRRNNIGLLDRYSQFSTLFLTAIEETDCCSVTYLTCSNTTTTAPPILEVSTEATTESV